MTLFLIYNALL